MTRQPLVLDTNIVLDVFLFPDVASRPVREGLEAGRLDWIATPHMRNELERVLAYAQIAPRLAFYGLTPADVLAGFDRHARIVEPAPRIGFSCKDPDDQVFVDLAAAHGAQLLSKDRAVLCMRKRLAGLGVVIGAVLDSAEVDPAKLLPSLD